MFADVVSSVRANNESNIIKSTIYSVVNSMRGDKDEIVNNKNTIKENTSSENKKKEMFTAYLVDMSFYINGKQKKRNFNDRPFWERDEKSRLKHIESAPIFKFKE